MPGQYPTHGAPSLRLCGKAEEAHATPRLYLCVRCRDQVLICSCCDRGNIYCERDCAAASRRTRQRACGQRYQRSLRGRRNHAARAKRYRVRQNKVTHQGSPRPPPDDVMRASAASTRNPQTARAAPLQPPWRCHRCGRLCSPFVRMDFLRRGRGRDPSSHRARGKDPAILPTSSGGALVPLRGTCACIPIRELLERLQDERQVRVDAGGSCGCANAGQAGLGQPW